MKLNTLIPGNEVSNPAEPHVVVHIQTVGKEILKYIKKMNNKIYWSRLIRRISTFLLLITFLVQIIAVVLIDADIGEFEMEEFHPISGFAFFGAILIHLVIIRKNLKSIISSKIKV